MNQLRLFVDRTLHDRYKITNEIGQGGMGAVFEAVDLTNQRHVAIKQMLPLDADLRASFERETHLLSRLDYPQLPRVIDRFEEETGMFLVMQFISGPNLGQLLATRQIPFAPSQVKLWAKDLLHTIAYLHKQTPAIIHQDIKPGNLKLLPDGSIVLLDFGLAREVRPGCEVDSAGILCYTPNYAPPEQIYGEQTGPQSDLYSLGATLYHLVTGKPPMDSVKRSSQKRSTGRDPLQPINQIIRGVPQPLTLMITKALALDQSQRPTSAAEMIDQLSANALAAPFVVSDDTPTEVTSVQHKPSVISGKRERININIESPIDYRQQRVVPLDGYRKSKTAAAVERVAKAASLASAIAILFTVATLSVYFYRATSNDSSAPTAITYPSPAVALQALNRPHPKFRRTEISYNEAQLSLPATLNVDELIRFRSRYLKANNRRPASLSSRSYAHPGANASTFPPAIPATQVPTF